MNRWARSLFAIFLAILVGSFAAAAGHAVADTLPGERSVAQLSLLVLWGLATAFGIGYLGAGIADWRRARHGAIAGGLFGWGAGATLFGLGPLPDILSQLLAMALAIPLGFAGGAWRERVMARRQRTLRADWVDGLPPLPLPIAPRRPYLATIAFLALAATAAGGLAVVHGWESARAAQATAVFGAAALFLLYRAFVYRPVWVIGDGGLTSPLFGFSIPWSEVRGASIRPLPPFDAVVLDVREPERYLAHFPSRYRRGFLGDTLMMIVAHSGYSAEEVRAVIARELAARGQAATGSAPPESAAR